MVNRSYLKKGGGKAAYPACVKPEVLYCPGVHVCRTEALRHDSNFDTLRDEVRYEVLWGQWRPRNTVSGEDLVNGS